MRCFVNDWSVFQNTMQNIGMYSNIELIHGSYDLSRHAILYRLQGLSFREYLNFECGIDFEAIAYEKILTSHRSITAKISEVPKLLGHFERYCKEGFYPLYIEDKVTYSARLLSADYKKASGLFCDDPTRRDEYQ